MTNTWNEADHPRDKEGKFTNKYGSVIASEKREKEKMQRRADILFTSMKDRGYNENLKETFKENIQNKSLEVEQISKNNVNFSDEELIRARKFIQGIEKFEPKAYRPTPNDVLTIGYGHTGLVDGKPITPDMIITKEKAEELYRKDFESHTYTLKNVQVPLTNNQKIALASFLFNVGPGGLSEKYSVLKKLNSGDYKGASDAMDTFNKQYNKQTGKWDTLSGLVNRRAKEKKLFFTPDGE